MGPNEVQIVVDSVFAFLEQKLSAHPWAVALLGQADKLIDANITEILKLVEQKLGK